MTCTAPAARVSEGEGWQWLRSASANGFGR
jgi:hypothetical protein